MTAVDGVLEIGEPNLTTSDWLRRKWNGRWSAVAVALSACLVFGGGLANGYTGDDYNWLVVASLPPQLFLRVIVHGARLRPLSLTVGWLGYRLWGTTPWAWHAFTLALHVLCALGVFYLASLLFVRDELALLAGLVFSVYPRHHQPVLWLAANQFLLSVTWILLTLIFHILYLRKKKRGFLALTWLCAAVALTANESSIALFPLMLFSELLVKGEVGASWREWLLSPRPYVKYAPLLLLLAVFIALTFGGDRAFALRTSGVDPRTQAETYHFLGLDLEVLRTFAAYVVYLVLPQIPLRTLDVNLISIIISLVVGSGLLVVLIRGTAFERYCLLWMVSTLLPFVLFVPFGNADRYFYLPAVGYALLVAALVSRLYRFLRERWRDTARTAAACLVGVYVVSSAVLVQRRLVEWRQAGNITQDIVSQVVQLQPELPKHSELFFVGLPQTYGQAYVFSSGIEGAIRIAYEELYLTIYRSIDPALIEWLLAQTEAARTPGHYVFFYDNGIVRDFSGRVENFEDFVESWWWYR